MLAAVGQQRGTDGPATGPRGGGLSLGSVLGSTILLASRAWHDADAHRALRALMILSILRLLPIRSHNSSSSSSPSSSSSAPASSDNRRRYERRASMIEYVLYHNSESQAAYSDDSTLSSRVSAAVKYLHSLASGISLDKASGAEGGSGSDSGSDSDRSSPSSPRPARRMDADDDEGPGQPTALPPPPQHLKRKRSTALELPPPPLSPPRATSVPCGAGAGAAPALPPVPVVVPGPAFSPPTATMPPFAIGTGRNSAKIRVPSSTVPTTTGPTATATAAAARTPTPTPTHWRADFRDAIVFASALESKRRRRYHDPEVVSFMSPGLADGGAGTTPDPLLLGSPTTSGGTPLERTAAAREARPPVDVGPGVGRSSVGAAGHVEALSLSSDQAKEVAGLLKTRLPAGVLVGLERVFNRQQMRRFQAERRNFEDRRVSPNDLLVWHGTRDANPRSIALGPDGLDLRVGKRDNCLYGRALYFADSPLYSSHFGHVVSDDGLVAEATEVLRRLGSQRRQHQRQRQHQEDAPLDTDSSDEEEDEEESKLAEAGTGTTTKEDVSHHPCGGVASHTRPPAPTPTPTRFSLVQLLLCQVQAGKVRDFGVSRNPGLSKPPAGFDSVTGTTHQAGGTRMWAVHNNAQSYTAFIVTMALPLPPAGTVPAASADPKTAPACRS